EEKEVRIEGDLLKRMSTVDFLIKEDKFEVALKSLAKIKEEAQTHRLEYIIIKAQERIELCEKLDKERVEQEKLKEEKRKLQQKLKDEERLKKERLKEEEKKEKERLKEEAKLEKERLEKEKERQKALEKEARIKEEFQKRISNVDYIIKDNKIDMAIKVLLEIQKEAQAQDLEDIVNSAEEKIMECKKTELETVNRIKQTILNLGAKFARLQLLDISEKSGVKDEALIENIIQEMIRNKEIHGEYFSSSKALAIEVAAVPVPVEEAEGKFNVFISYSTLDTDYFQISKIVRRLELYPEIKKVLFWEADSKQNIVEFMEETLRKTNAFVLFCSENSIKSEAVKGEWQSAYQMVKKGLMKMIPVYEDEDHIPRLLWQMLNVKFTPDDFEGFIQKLYEEILR
ncbi:MAG: toll/interleukin-1 receptor domain-containing protein, partial [Candidatus Thorarchaeota archaeon]